MSVVIESVTSSTGYEIYDGQVSDRWYWDISKPTGLALGDLMVFIGQNERGDPNTSPPAGWTDLGFIQNGSASYKFADSGDVAASTFRFLAPDDASTKERLLYRLYRISGTHGSAVPQDSYTAGSHATSSGSPANFDPDISPPSGTLMFYIVNGRESGVNPPTAFSVSVTGPTGTVTEVVDDNTPEGGYFALYTQITTSAADITDVEISFTPDSGQDDTFYFSAFALYPQQDASTTLTLTETSQTAFAPAGSAGANATLTTTETSNTKFDPTGAAFDPTRWTTTPKS